MHNYAILCKTMFATDQFLYDFLQSIMLKVCVKFQPNPFSRFWEKLKKCKENAQFMYNYDNLCKNMHVNDPILLSSLCLNIKKVHTKFQLDRISSFLEKLYRRTETAKKRWIMHNYADLCKTIHVTDPTLFSSQRLIKTKVYVKFYLDPISTFFFNSF